jgi:hypothetical protein
MEDLTPDQALTMRETYFPPEVRSALGAVSIGLCTVRKTPPAHGLKINIHEDREGLKESILSHIPLHLQENVIIENAPGTIAYSAS